MFHYAMHARRGLWLFHDWEEARALWDRLATIPGLHHLCLLPDRVYLLLHQQRPLALRGAMSGHARWLGERWGWPGLSLWQPLGTPAPVTGGEPLLRARRAVLLAPCQAGLADDPLGWVFSTHRDATALAWPNVVAADHDPATFHASTCGGPALTPGAAALPAWLLQGERPSCDQVAHALSAVTRTPLPRLARKGRRRHQLIHCTKALGCGSARALAEQLGVHHSAVVRASPERDAVVQLVERVLADPRFPALEAGDLRGTSAWQRYRAWRVARGFRRAS